MDNLLSATVSHLELIDSEMARNTSAMVVNNTTNGSPQIAIVGSQTSRRDPPRRYRTTGSEETSGEDHGLVLWATPASTGSCSRIRQPTSNSNGDRRGPFVDHNIGDIATDPNATNGCQVQLDMRDSTLFGAGTILKTFGDVLIHQREPHPFEPEPRHDRHRPRSGERPAGQHPCQLQPQRLRQHRKRHHRVERTEHGVQQHQCSGSRVHHALGDPAQMIP